MGSHRDFDAARAERVRHIDPVTFVLGGRRFTCVPEPTLGDALALADAPEPDESPTAALKATLRFVEAMIQPSQRRRFRRMARRQKANWWAKGRPPVGSHEVYELAVWLASEHSGRPTRPSSGSSNGPDPDGRSSRSTPSPEPGETSSASASAPD